VLNQGQLDVIAEIYLPQYVLHAPVGTGDTVGYDGLRQRVIDFRTGFPDLHFTVETIILEGDDAAVRWTLAGTHTGPFVGIEPTGRAIRVPGILMLRFAGDRVVEGWSGFDALDLMQQLGVVPGS
jgi:predicted ester cyclase